MKKIAVMDLGTNTFHLLIATIYNDGFIPVLREEVPVKLGEGGLTKGLITKAAFERGVETMDHFHQLINAENVDTIHAVATSAMRNAQNGKAFIEKVKARTGILIEIINGQQEAEYIYGGVRAANLLSDQNALIMDIGGGSVEFILCNQHHIHWKQSFEIGAVRLMAQFHQQDPIPHTQINALQHYLKPTLKQLFEAARIHPVTQLIGSAGSFETFRDMVISQKGKQMKSPERLGYHFKTSDFLQIAEMLKKSTHEERSNRKDILALRVDMIVVASLLTRFILENLKIERLSMSDYALKEGVAAMLSRC